MAARKTTLGALSTKTNKPNPADRFNQLLDTNQIKQYPEAFIMPKDIIPHPKNTEIYDIENIEELAADFYKHGILQPLLVHEQPGSKYMILAGHRRFEAIQLILKRTPTALKNGIHCKVVPKTVSEIDAEIMLIHANSLNRDRNDDTKRKEASRLIELYKIKEQEGDPVNEKLHLYLSENLNVSKRQAYKFISIETSLSKELYHLYQEKGFDINTAEIIANMDQEAQKLVYEYYSDASIQDKNISAFIKHMKKQSDNYKAALKEHGNMIQQIEEEIVRNKSSIVEVSEQIKSIPEETILTAPDLQDAVKTLKNYSKITTKNVETQEKQLEEVKSKKPKVTDFFTSPEQEQMNAEIKNSILTGKDWIRILTSNIGRYKLTKDQLKELEGLRSQLDRAITAAAIEGADADDKED